MGNRQRQPTLSAGAFCYLVVENHWRVEAAVSGASIDRLHERILRRHPRLNKSDGGCDAEVNVKQVPAFEEFATWHRDRGYS